MLGPLLVIALVALACVPFLTHAAHRHDETVVSPKVLGDLLDFSDITWDWPTVPQPNDREES